MQQVITGSAGVPGYNLRNWTMRHLMHQTSHLDAYNKEDPAFTGVPYFRSTEYYQTLTIILAFLSLQGQPSPQSVRD